MDDTYDAILALKASIDKQNEIQQEASNRILALTDMIGHLITEMQRPNGNGDKPDVNAMLG